MLNFGPEWHLLFDIIACLAALLIGLWQKTQAKLPNNPHLSDRYIFVLLVGCVVGGYSLGTWNLVLSGMPHLAHSVLGALAGGIAAIEIYKAYRGIRVPTGASYALPFCLAVSVGRIGCFLGGLADQTYGLPTLLPWAVDFGDGIPRHPVQLYEALTMGCVTLCGIIWLNKRPAQYTRYAFPSIVAFYAAQRFLWEFLKPYHSIWQGLNLFQLVCLLLIAYSLFLIFSRQRHA